MNRLEVTINRWRIWISKEGDLTIDASEEGFPASIEAGNLNAEPSLLADLKLAVDAMNASAKNEQLINAQRGGSGILRPA